MSNRTGGSISTLLLSLPLAAVAFMAVFGVPQFVPIMASGGDEELDLRTGRRGERGRNLDQLFDEFSTDTQLDAPAFDSNERRSASSSQNWWNEDSSAGNRPESRSVVYEEAGHHRSVSPAGYGSSDSPAPVHALSYGSSTVANAPDPSDPLVSLGTPATPDSHIQTAMTTGLLDWQAASRRLTELGVSKYHLERGHKEGSFLFICLFTSAANPNQVNRFEAEASDPLHAVNNVLTQIDQWLKQQYASRARSSARTDSLSWTR